MYVIAVYDMKKDRTEKARKICQQYLTHAQGSVFEGEITKGMLKQLTKQIEDLHTEQESVIIYEIERTSNVTRHIYGEDPDPGDQFF